MVADRSKKPKTADKLVESAEEDNIHNDKDLLFSLEKLQDFQNELDKVTTLILNAICINLWPVGVIFNFVYSEHSWKWIGIGFFLYTNFHFIFNLILFEVSGLL